MHRNPRLGYLEEEAWLNCRFTHRAARVSPVQIVLYDGKADCALRHPRTSEQEPERGFFFPPEDPEALATAMRAAYNQFDTRQDSATRDLANSRFPERQRELAKAYLRISPNSCILRLFASGSLTRTRMRPCRI